MLAEADRRAVEVAEAVADKRRRLADLRPAQAAASIVELGSYSGAMSAGGGWCSVSSPEWDFCYSLWIDPQGQAISRVVRWAATPTAWGCPEAAANDARVLLAYRESLEAAKREHEVQCQLLRDAIGPMPRPLLPPPLLEANGGLARDLAEAIYTDRAFDRLPILADALEDAGCTDRAILDHCREPGEHVRGCWVVDLVLGKS